MTKYTNPKNGETFETDLNDTQALDTLRQIAVRGAFQSCKPASEKTREFATSLHNSWKRGRISTAQWFWVHKLAYEHRNQAEREEAKAITRAENTRDIGDFSGVKNLFDRATASGLKRPKIRFTLPGVGELRLSVAGPKSSQPGAINVTDAGSFGENVWYGRVTQGEFVTNPRVAKETTEFVTKFLKLLAKSPALVASEYGKRTGNCCFCGRELTDERSVFVGYGPVCAAKYNLPHGERPEYTTEEVAEFAELIESIHQESVQ